MGQVTIYLDLKTEKKMINIVKKSGLSKSKWVANLIKEKTYSSWPKSITELSGSWKNMPTAEEIRKDLGADVKRESI